MAKDQAFMDTAEVATLLGLKPGTLENWRLRGQGPAFRKFGGRGGPVRYSREEVLAWAALQRRRSTSDAEGRDPEATNE